MRMPGTMPARTVSLRGRGVTPYTLDPQDSIGAYPPRAVGFSATRLPQLMVKDDPDASPTDLLEACCWDCCCAR